MAIEDVMLFLEDGEVFIYFGVVSFRAERITSI